MTDAIKWGGWTAISGSKLQYVIDSGRIPAGTTVKISKRSSWLPAWLSRMFTDLNKRTAVVEWPGPGGTLGPDIQAIAFVAGSGFDLTVGRVARGY